MDLKTATEYAQGMLERGEVADVAEANTEIVRMMGVRIVSGPIPRDVRQALNASVKAGRLGHLKKDGLKPEAYFHPNSIWRAKEQRSRIARGSIQAIGRVMVTRSQVEAANLESKS